MSTIEYDLMKRAGCVELLSPCGHLDGGELIVKPTCFRSVLYLGRDDGIWTDKVTQ